MKQDLINYSLKMLNSSLKYKLLLVFILFWSYSASARDLFAFDDLTTFLLFFISWIFISLSGIFIFKRLKETYNRFEFMFLQHFFLLAFSALFFMIFWMYMEDEVSSYSLIEKISSEAHFTPKIVSLIIGFVVLIWAIFVIVKDYKKR